MLIYSLCPDFFVHLGVSVKISCVGVLEEDYDSISIEIEARLCKIGALRAGFHVPYPEGPCSWRGKNKLASEWAAWDSLARLEVCQPRQACSPLSQLFFGFASNQSNIFASDQSNIFKDRETAISCLC